MTKLSEAQEKVLRKADELEYEGLFLRPLGKLHRTIEILLEKGFLKENGEKQFTFRFGYVLTDAGHDWLNEHSTTPKPLTEEQKQAMRERYQQRKAEIAAQAATAPIAPESTPATFEVGQKFIVTQADPEEWHEVGEVITVLRVENGEVVLSSSGWEGLVEIHIETPEFERRIKTGKFAIEPQFAIGQWVTIETISGKHRLGKVENSYKELGCMFYDIRLESGSIYRDYQAPELADASLEYIYPALPEPVFKVGDLVLINNDLGHVVSMVWDCVFGWKLYVDSLIPGYYEWEVTPIPTDHPLRPVFDRAAKCAEQQRLDQIEADKLIASFNPIAQEFAEIEQSLKTDPLPYFVDYEDKPSRDWNDYMSDKFAKDVQ